MLSAKRRVSAIHVLSFSQEFPTKAAASAAPMLNSLVTASLAVAPRLPSL